MDSNILFDPYSPEFSGDPYQVYLQLRQQQPIFYHKPWSTWIFSRYQDINALLADKRLGRTMDHVSTDGEIAAYRQKNHWAEAPAQHDLVLGWPWAEAPTQHDLVLGWLPGARGPSPET